MDGPWPHWPCYTGLGTPALGLGTFGLSTEGNYYESYQHPGGVGIRLAPPMPLRNSYSIKTCKINTSDSVCKLYFHEANN